MSTLDLDCKILAGTGSQSRFSLGSIGIAFLACKWQMQITKPHCNVQLTSAVCTASRDEQWLQARSQGAGDRVGCHLWQQGERNRIITFQAISLVHCKPTNVTVAINNILTSQGPVTGQSLPSRSAGRAVRP